ncbi:MAG: CHASE4 domain-containing protein [Hyphomonadaceae bacterium]
MVPPSALDSHSLERRAWVTAGAPILTLVLVVILAAVAAFVNFAGQQNRAFADSSKRLVASAMEGRLRALSDLTLDFANWNDAYQAISVEWDQAWIDNNFYSSVADGLIIFTPDGELRYTWFAANLLGSSARLPPKVVAAARTVPNIEALMRARSVSDTVARAVVKIDNRLVLLSVAPISPENTALRLRASEGAVNYLAAVQVLTDHEIADIGADLSLRDFSYSPDPIAIDGHQTVSLLLETSAGDRVGELTWRHERPGSAAFMSQIGPVIVGLLLIGVLTVFVARSLVARQIAASNRAELESEAHRLRSDFIVGISEEMNTPLNAIIGYAELIREEAPPGPASDSVREDAGRILTAARQIRQMMGEPLAASRAARKYKARSDA